MKSIDTNMLRTNAKAYMDCVNYCRDMLSRMDSAHVEMDAHWKGGAHEGYMTTYDGVVKPSINSMIEGCEICHDNLNAYADVCDERDMMDQRAFGQ